MEFAALPGCVVMRREEELNSVHTRIRARVEHALAHMKSWNILRNCRRKHDGVYDATSGVALMRNLTMTH